MSIDDRSFELLNHRASPVKRPTEFRSELDVESDSKARSLWRGVNVGRCAILRLMLLNGLWLARN